MYGSESEKPVVQITQHLWKTTVTLECVMALMSTRYLRVLKGKYLYSHLYFQHSWRPSLIVLCCSDAHRVRCPSSLRPVGPVHHHLTGGRVDGAEGAGQGDGVSSGCMDFCWSVDGDGQDGPRGCGWDDRTPQSVVRYTHQNNNTLQSDSCGIITP